jgi:polysaccharide biosynthesis transport protein
MPRPNPGDQLPAPNFGQQAMPVTPTGARYQGGPGHFAPSPFAIANPTSAPPPGVRALPTIVELVHSFKRRWVLALLVGGLIGTALAVAIWMIMPSGKHQARAIIQIKTEVPGFVGKSIRLETEQFDKLVESELAKMKTKQFLAKVAADSKAAKLPMIAYSDAKERVIEDSVKLKRDPSEIITATMTGDDQDQLRVLLDVYTKQFVQDARNEENTERKQDLDRITKMIAATSEDIDKAKKQIGVDAQKEGRDGVEKFVLERDMATLSTKIRGLKDAHERVKLELARLNAEKADPKLVTVDPTEVAEAVANHPLVMTKATAYSIAQQKLEAMKKTYNEGAPALRQYIEAEKTALAELTATRKEVVESETTKLRAIKVGSLGRKIDEAKKTERELDEQTQANEAEYKDITNRLAKLVEVGVKQVDVKNVLEPLLINRNKLEEQRQQLEFQNRGLEDQDKRSRYKLLEEAVVYENYNLKNKLAFAIGAAVVGLFAISLIVSYLEWRNRRVDGVDQVVTELGMRVIGTIPAFPSRAALRSGEASQNQNWRFILNESVNSTRTMLLHTAKTQQMQVILVTSAMQGEGKTSLSSQLATSMATAGLRTLVLDCDLRNPSMQKLFDIPVAPGCAEILLQEIDISDAVQPTSVPNLWIIPAGQCNHRVIAALAQGHPLEALFNRLRGQFDIIIVDSCPILPVADTLLVAQHVDGVVFSILQDVSQLPKVQDASDRLVQLNIPLLGAVVNGITPDIQAYGYNYVKQLPA